MKQELVNKNSASVDYVVVHPIAGHQKNKGVELVEAAKDIFARVKEKAMQCAVKGEFITFTTIDELQDKLFIAVQNGFAIGVYDEDTSG